VGVISGRVVMIVSPTSSIVSTIVTSIIATPAPTVMRIKPRVEIAEESSPMPGAVVPGRIIPRAVSVIKPRIIPTVIATPAIAVSYVDIKADIGRTVRITGFISVTVIAFADIQVHLVGSDYGYFAGRMVTDYTLGIFRVRPPLVFNHHRVIVFRFISVVKFVRFYSRRTAVIFIHIPFFTARRRFSPGGGGYCYDSGRCIIRLYILFLFRFFTAFPGREVHIIKELFLRRHIECGREHNE
jgi:hypothetical protein